MRFLQYRDLDLRRVLKAFDKVRASIEADALTPRWLHPTRPQFELFDKPIVLDDAQDEIRRHPAPLTKCRT